MRHRVTGPMLPATLTFIVRRLIHAIPVVLIVAVGVFFILEAAPGDAVDAYLADIGGGDLALAEQLRQQWGLDQSVLVRFLAYMQSVVTLDLGRSVTVGAPVTEAILNRLPTTLLLMGSAIVDVGRPGRPPGRRRRDATWPAARQLPDHLCPDAQRHPRLLAGPHLHRGLRGLAGLVPERGSRRPSTGRRTSLDTASTWHGTWCCRCARSG